jgi:hypothetical protein
VSAERMMGCPSPVSLPGRCRVVPAWKIGRAAKRVTCANGGAGYGRESLGMTVVDR